VRTRSQGPPTGVLLWIGFGGLIALLGFAGVSGLSAVREIQVRNQRIRTDYVQRSRVLEQLRSDIYLSGTYVRDFLLETDNSRAESYRTEFERTRQRIRHGVAEYQQMPHPREAGVFPHLTKALAEYFDALKPALQWNADERRRLGPAFMRDEVLTRRMTMIDLANQVSQVNQRQLESGNRLVEQLFWSFRRRLVMVLILTVSVGIALAGFSIYRILQLEREGKERLQDVLQARREAQDLSARLVDAQEQERRNIARELHDEVGQSLSALLLGIGNVGKTESVAHDTGLQQQMQSLRTLAERSVTVVRNISLLLRPSMLDDLGLVPALQWQAREFSRTTDMRVNVASEELAENLPEEYKTCIYRVVQEALHNCQRHAQAKNVRIQVQQMPDALVLAIQDDGRGFRPERDRGLGLLGIEERVKRLHGTLMIDSEEGKGTLISITLPLSENHENATMV
jgi:signal transduction histidine kinase